MPEYAYNKEFKIWYCLDNSPFYTMPFPDKNGIKERKIDKSKLLSEEKINELRNARKNKKFIIYDNRIKLNNAGYYSRGRYPGISSDYIYEDVSDFKLFLENGTRALLIYNSNCCTSTGRIPLEWMVNPEILTKDLEDYSAVVPYVENNAEADTHCPELYNKDYAAHQAYFLERAKLYYSDLDEDAKLIYNIEGNYNLED